MRETRPAAESGADLDALMDAEPHEKLAKRVGHWVRFGLRTVLAGRATTTSTAPGRPRMKPRMAAAAPFIWRRRRPSLSVRLVTAN
jgi:hypothetical protein